MVAPVATFLALFAALFAFAAGLGLTGSPLVGGGIAILVACASAILAPRVLAPELDARAASRALKIIALVAAIGALIQVARITAYIVDPSRPDFSFAPSSQWEVRHSCLTAYHIAGEAAPTAPNLYADSLYSIPTADPTQVRKARRLGPFSVDVFEYPPPFLLLPRFLHTAAPDFLSLRTAWFGLVGLFGLFGMLAIGRLMGPVAGTRALLLAPLVWLAIPTLSMIQKGNVQFLIIVMSMVAMLLFSRGRWAAGGALLGFASVSKLYPTLLLVYLVAGKRWRAVGWTAAFSMAFVAVSLLDTGWGPYRAFVGHLGGLFSGESFPAFRNPAAVAINFSVPGLVFKLKLFDVPGMTFGTAKAVGWIYTVAVAPLVFLAGRRLRNQANPIAWLAVLVLATLRSPFLPQAYAAFPPIWLLVLMAAKAPPTAKNLVPTLLAWGALNVYWPQDWPADPRMVAVATLIPQTVTAALALLAIRRESSGSAEPDHSSRNLWSRPSASSQRFETVSR